MWSHISFDIMSDRPLCIVLQKYVLKWAKKRKKDEDITLQSIWYTDSSSHMPGFEVTMC